VRGIRESREGMCAWKVKGEMDVGGGNQDLKPKSEGRCSPNAKGSRDLCTTVFVEINWRFFFSPFSLSIDLLFVYIFFF